LGDVERQGKPTDGQDGRTEILHQKMDVTGIVLGFAWVL
jgi:hypothetical protein